MKRTIIALMALAGVAAAAEVKVEPNTPTTIPSDGEAYDLNFNAKEGAGLAYFVQTVGDAAITGTNGYELANLAGSTYNFTLGGTLTVSGNLGINLKDGSTFNYNFGQSGLITGGKFSLAGTTSIINITTETTALQLTSTEGDLYERSLITPAEAVWFSDTTAKSGNWTIKDENLEALGFTCAGVLGYRDNKYYSATTGAEVILGEKEYALVLDNIAYGSNAGATSVRLVANLVPEPTTATLSLLALTGLAVRRRRK